MGILYRNTFLILFLLCILQGNLIAQVYSIKGTVKDDDHGNPLVGAHVAVHETQAGSLTDENGYFEISGVKPGSYHLHASFLGYESASKTIKIRSEDVQVNFQLHHSPLEIHEFVIEAEPMKSPGEEHSVTIEVADENFLQKNQGTNLAESMEKIPGMSIISSGTGVGKPVIRGLSFNRITTTQNGIKQEGQQWGAEHGLEIDQNTVGRVELVKGPASVLYGSDAIGGVLNIKPPHPPDKNTLSATIQGTGQSNTNLAGGSATVEGNHEGKFMRVIYSRKQYEDYTVPADSFSYNRFVFPIREGKLSNTAGNEEGMSGVLGINKSWGVSQINLSSFSQMVGFFPGAHGRPSAESVANDGDYGDLDAPYQSIQHVKAISNTHLLVRENWLEIDLGVQKNLRKEFEEADGRTGEELALGLDLLTYTANIHYHHHLTDSLNLVYGVSGNVKENKWEGREFLIPAYSEWNSGLFVFAEHKWKPTVTLSSGLRFDMAQLNTESYYSSSNGNVDDLVLIAPEISRTFQNVSGGAGFSWFPTHAFNLKFNMGSAFRYPTAPELASNGVHHGAFRYEMGDASLEPERSYQLDLNISYHKKHYHLKWTPYFNYFDNYIYLRPTGKYAPSGAGQVYQYSQSRAVHSGTELVLDYHFWKHLHLGVIGEYVFGYNPESGYPLPFIPAPMATVEAEYTIPMVKDWLQNVYFSTSTKLASAQNLTARNEPETPGYAVLNFGMGGDFHIGKQPVKLYFQARNITDNKYFNHLSRFRILNLPEPGRNFVLSLKIPLFRVKLKKTDA